MDKSAAKSAEGEHPIPDRWTAGATVFAATGGVAAVVAAVIWIGSLHFPTWFGFALVPFACVGFAWCWGRWCAYQWATRIVKAAARYKISYPSAEFGKYYVRLKELTPSARGSSISAPSVSTAVATAVSLASGGGAAILGHLKFAAPLEAALVIAIIVFLLLYLAYTGAINDYTLEFHRESIQLHAAHQTAAQRPPHAKSAGTNVPMPLSPAMTFRILDVKGLLKAFGGALWWMRLP
ncbi:MAG: hypothetical protein M0Z54_06605 [Thermaerobacter sp.]|nr:hypothetical protein [Thermaerobacter sp.]